MLMVLHDLESTVILCLYLLAENLLFVISFSCTRCGSIMNYYLLGRYPDIRGLLACQQEATLGSWFWHPKKTSVLVLNGIKLRKIGIYYIIIESRFDWQRWQTTITGFRNSGTDARALICKTNFNNEQPITKNVMSSGMVGMR